MNKPDGKICDMAWTLIAIKKLSLSEVGDSLKTSMYFEIFTIYWYNIDIKV